MELEFSRQIGEKYSNIKFHEILSRLSRVPRGQTDGRAGMRKLIVAFCIFAKATINSVHICWESTLQLLSVPVTSAVGIGGDARTSG